ncbi:hypothetical protein [Acinetobacter sp.]|uniref:hypothetical protein n=1 Tax=Acinetobacter sp. TaxID=472 RepID=UPI003890F151
MTNSKRTTLADCGDAAGSFNNPATPNSGLPDITTVIVPPGTYVPPELCVGTYQLTSDACASTENTYQQALAAQTLAISGAPLNVFKLLGNHEQGKLIDLVGRGEPIASGGNPANAYDELVGSWVSDTTGLSVLTAQTYIGYDFGIRRTSYGAPENAPGAPDSQHITSIRIKQGDDASTRALQVRVDRSDGNYSVNPLKVTFSGVGNGGVGGYQQGPEARPGSFMLFADSPTKFTVMFASGAGTDTVGIATVGVVFNTPQGSFTINKGTIPFQKGDSFMVPVEMDWKRVDIVNLPNIAAPALIRIKQSAASRYWRIVPTSFAGATSDTPWVVDKLELFDYQATTLDDIQDPLFMENRDRDYAKSSIQLRVQYTPFDAVSDLSKFGFQVADIYSFTVSFAQMVTQLGRPIVVGDVLEVPSEMQYDHHLRPVRKFLEVTDVGWAADGYTSGWVPIIYRFQAQQLIPGQEHRDLLGTIDTQKYIVDDGRFFEGIEQIQTAPLTVTEANEAEAVRAVPEKGTNVREEASGANRFGQPGSYDGVGLYVEDGLPPDGAPFTTGYEKLPDVSTAKDGDYFRLEYEPYKKLPARLYKFSEVKNKWLYAETDRRSQRSAHRPSQLEILNMNNMSPTTKKIT